MIPFEMVEPTSLKEALSLLDPQEPTIRPVAGGTALMLMMKAGVFTPTRLVCLHRIEPDFSRIALTDNGELRIGAMATLRELEQDANVRRACPCWRGPCAHCRACGCATSRESAARWRTAIRTWICRRF